MRLNENELQELTALADKRGVPASTPARDLLLPHLSEGVDTPRSVLARMRADLDALAATVGQ